MGARVNPLLPWVMERLPACFGLQHEARLRESADEESEHWI